MLIVLAGGLGERLRFLQRRIDGFGARDHLGELLRNLIAELLKFGDVYVLDPDVWDCVDRWVSHVGVGDRFERDLRESGGGLLVLGDRVCRLASSWSDTGPAQLTPD